MDFKKDLIRLGMWLKRAFGRSLMKTNNSKIEALESVLLPLPQVEMPLTHLFAPGVYFREIFMPAGTFVIGHEHKTEHFNVVLAGKAKVSIDGKAQIITAPCVFVSKPGVRKVLEILEDMRWATIHPTHETSIPKLEKLLVKKSETFRHNELLISEFSQLKQISK